MSSHYLFREESPLDQDAPVRRAAGFDAEDLIDRMMGSEDLAREVAGAFLDDMPGQLAALQQALSHASLSEIRMAAHAIKGAAANAGGESVRQVAAELEKAAAGGDLGAAAKLIPVLVWSFDALLPILEEFRNRR